MSSTVAQAIAKAEQLAREGEARWKSKCLGFVAQMYGYAASGTPPGNGRDVPYAIDAWKVSKAKHAGDKNPPIGALVYWDASSTNKAGHVALSAGGGNVYTTHTGGGVVRKMPLSSVGLPNYLGWADPTLAAGGYRLPKDYSATATTAPGKAGSPSGGTTSWTGTPSTIPKQTLSIAGLEIGTADGSSPVDKVGKILAGMNPMNAFVAMASRFFFITLPSSWVRIQAFMLGTLFVVLAVILFAWEGTSSG